MNGLCKFLERVEDMHLCVALLICGEVKLMDGSRRSQQWLHLLYWFSERLLAAGVPEQFNLEKRHCECFPTPFWFWLGSVYQVVFSCGMMNTNLIFVCVVEIWCSVVREN